MGRGPRLRPFFIWRSMRDRSAQVAELEALAAQPQLAALRLPAAVRQLDEELLAGEQAPQHRVERAHGWRRQRGRDDAAGDERVGGYSHGGILLLATTVRQHCR